MVRTLHNALDKQIQNFFTTEAQRHRGTEAQRKALYY